MLKEFSITTNNRVEMIDIVHQVNRLVKESGVMNGMCTVFIPHTTAGITINENADPDVVSDMVMELTKIVPFNDHYRHVEGNSAAHIKASMMGASENIIISNGHLLLGTWQGVYFCEFDGPRNRKVIIKILAD